MKKFGFHGEARRQMRNESINSVNRVLGMFKMDMSTATDQELKIMANILLEAGANYVQAVREAAKQ